MSLLGATAKETERAFNFPTISTLHFAKRAWKSKVSGAIHYAATRTFYNAKSNTMNFPIAETGRQSVFEAMVQISGAILLDFGVPNVGWPGPGNFAINFDGDKYSLVFCSQLEGPTYQGITAKWLKPSSN